MLILNAVGLQIRPNETNERSSFIGNPFLKGVQEFRSDASLRSVDNTQGVQEFRRMLGMHALHFHLISLPFGRGYG